MVLEVTESLEELLHGQTLRGMVWSLFVDKTHKKRPAVQGTPIDCPPATALRDAFDVRPILQRAKHTSEIAFGVPNPVPRRLVLEASYGETPEALFGSEQHETAKASPEEMARLRERMRDQMKGLRKQTCSSRPDTVNGKGANHE